MDTRYRTQLVKAMRWFRAKHPEYSRVKVIKHGWHGHAVFAEYRSEYCCVATVHDVLTQFSSHAEKDCPDAHTCRHGING